MNKSYWEMRVRELEKENKRLKIRLDQYEQDSSTLLEEHGFDPSDKIDREDLKCMLNYLIGKNRKLEDKNNELMAKCGHQAISINEIIDELRTILIYCRTISRENNRGIIKLLVREEIKDRVNKILEGLE